MTGLAVPPASQADEPSKAHRRGWAWRESTIRSIRAEQQQRGPCREGRGVPPRDRRPDGEDICGIGVDRWHLWIPGDQRGDLPKAATSREPISWYQSKLKKDEHDAPTDRQTRMKGG
jgi:hypothetical protein